MPRQSDHAKYEALLFFLQKYFSEYHYAPTYEEMRVGAGLSSKCIVDRYLIKLRADQMIQEEPNKSRTLQLTEKGKYYPGKPPQRVAAYVSKAARINEHTKERIIPLPILGRTFAGKTTMIASSDFAYSPESTLEVSEGMLPQRANLSHYFVLEVSGDSMIEAGIFDGDYVICRESVEANNGQMAVILLEDVNETTLKYFYRENGHVRLQPANAEMEPIIIEDPTYLRVRGVVVQVVHCRE